MTEEKSQSHESMIELVHQAMDEFETGMKNYADDGRRIANKTTRINRGAIILFFLVGISTLFMIKDFTSDMVILVKSMESMYHHFGGVSKNMHNMTESVVHINTNVRGMPIMSKKMQEISQTMTQMQHNMSSMKQNITTMDRSVSNITLGVNEMANRFDHLNQTVQLMDYNVQHMANPIRRMMP
jgi:archaellum component FlaC